MAKPSHARLGPSKQVRQGEPMMDGPWQEVIYNLSLLCVSVRQLRQTERDKEGQTWERGTDEDGDEAFLYFSQIFHLFSGVLQHHSTSQGCW